MKWFPSKKQEDGSYQIPKKWVSLHYYDALNVLFRIENSLRVFAYVVLKNYLCEKWGDVSLKSDDDQDATLASIAKKRISQDKDFGYLGYSITSPLMYLTSGEVVRVIFSEKNWAHFKIFFKGKKEIMRNKLDEIGNIRNALAHFRPIKEDDVEVVKQYAKQVLLGVEECLTGIVSCHNIVPTNSKDNWYKTMGELTSELFKVNILQDKNQEWIELKLTFDGVVLHRNVVSEEVHLYSVLKIETPQIIAIGPTIRAKVTYMRESIRPISMPQKGKMPDFSKDIGIIFSRKLLAENHSAIASELKTMFDKVENEVQLVNEDNLAKGTFVSLQTIPAIYETNDNKGKWSFFADQLKCPVSSESPPEYWGEVGYDYSDFISGTNKYPWMPSPIVKEENIFLR